MLRPLTPHFSIFKKQKFSVISITHRFAGFWNFLIICIIFKIITFWNTSNLLISFFLINEINIFFNLICITTFFSLIIHLITSLKSIKTIF
uniref:succinate:cytochrome c oxidoreductase subunit 3 n=1 Tax=Porphyridium aerugineum TaxID=2792 RepID=UPI001FCD9E7F|nr:succinate:cytochrome c oxidoreductase subunit 3 [Porphyridium aerugineum]UNJ18830.1 succinate:cytochrome c oxidoreductase subunit 3 [Porphyridium aerugineum]